MSLEKILLIISSTALVTLGSCKYNIYIYCYVYVYGYGYLIALEC